MMISRCLRTVWMLMNRTGAQIGYSGHGILQHCTQPYVEILLS